MPRGADGDCQRGLVGAGAQRSAGVFSPIRGATERHDTRARRPEKLSAPYAERHESAARYSTAGNGGVVGGCLWSGRGARAGGRADAGGGGGGLAGADSRGGAGSHGGSMVSWMGHPLAFFRGLNGRAWYALAAWMWGHGAGPSTLEIRAHSRGSGGAT